MKPNGHFKYTKRTKTIGALTCTNKELRDSFKSCMIQAQLAASQQPAKEKK